MSTTKKEQSQRGGINDTVISLRLAKLFRQCRRKNTTIGGGNQPVWLEWVEEEIIDGATGKSAEIPALATITAEPQPVVLRPCPEPSVIVGHVE